MHREILKQRILSEPSKCISYLEELISANKFNDGEALGISLLLIKNGPERLTDEQWYAFIENGLLPHNYVEKCERCTDHIHWSDMFSAIFINKDHLCAYCSYLENKD
ncbi:hypothetical protein ACIQ2D_09660 [Lysinibacillus sp. NPDC097287]|uniref:hypothetical protein n=1 Tax=Lysinibacillus sp. NPDC097287 TaxID=3364144 RepID=UPI0038277CE8